MRRVLFMLTFSLIMGHELDAVTQHEWRLLPILKYLDDETGRAVFVAIHVPLIAWLLWMNAQRGWLFHALFGGFCAVHVGLHWAYGAHPLYTFHGALSQALIWGAGVSGAALAGAALANRTSCPAEVNR